MTKTKRNQQHEKVLRDLLKELPYFNCKVLFEILKDKDDYLDGTMIVVLLVFILSAVFWVPFMLVVPYRLFIFLIAFYYSCDAQQPNTEQRLVHSGWSWSLGDSGGNSAAVDQVFSMFKDLHEKKNRR